MSPRRGKAGAYLQLQLSISLVWDRDRKVHIPQRHIDDTMMSQSRHSGNRCALLSATYGPGGDEETSVLPVKASRLPLLASLVPESLPLGREIAITSWDTKKECVIVFELIGSDQWDD